MLDFLLQIDRLDIGLFLNKVIIGCLIVSALFSIYRWKYLPAVFRFLAYFVFWNLLTEITLKLLANYQLNNLPVTHIYIAGTFVTLGLFFREMGLFAEYAKQYFWKFMAAVLSFIALNTIFLQGLHQFNSNAFILVQLLLIIAALTYFFQLHEQDNLAKALNWANAAILIYNAGSLFVFLFGNYFLAMNEEMHLVFWLVNCILNLLFQILIFFSIWKASSIRQTF